VDPAAGADIPGPWFATIASNVGTWMQNVGASLMTTLSPSPLIIVMVQAATSLAEGLLRHDVGDRFTVESAGTKPSAVRRRRSRS